LYSLARNCVTALGTHDGAQRAPVPERASLATLDTTAPELARPVARLAVATLLNGRERWIPTQFAVSSRWTELCQVAQLAGAVGGFEARSGCVPTITAQIRLPGCADASRVLRRIQAVAPDLLQAGLDAQPDSCIPIGCIPALELYDMGGGNLVAVLHVEGSDELSRRVIASAAHTIAARLAPLAECQGEPDIRMGVLEVERVTTRCRIKLCHVADGVRQPGSPSAPEGRVPPGVDKLMHDFGRDAHQPELAAFHNAHVLEGLTVAARALSIDARCVLDPARRHAARWGSCEPLAKWRRAGDMLVGELGIPVDLGLVYDVLRRQDNESPDVVALQAARDLIIQVATIGLGASCAYLRSVLLTGWGHRTRAVGSALPPPIVHEAQPARRSPGRKLVDQSGVHQTVRAVQPRQRSLAAAG
jgi:hydroxymethylglutaryl-CoA reductase